MILVIRSTPFCTPSAQIPKDKRTAATIQKIKVPGEESISLNFAATIWASADVPAKSPLAQRKQ